MSTDLVQSVEEPVRLSYRDMKPTEADLAAMREKHPDASDAKVMAYTKAKLHAEHRLTWVNPDGSPAFGGSQRRAGRPQKTLTDSFKEFSDDRAGRLVVDALEAALQSTDEKVRLKAAVETTKIDLAYAKIQEKEDRLKSWSRENLEEAAGDIFKAMMEDPEKREILQTKLAQLKARDEAISVTPEEDDEQPNV